LHDVFSRASVSNWLKSLPWNNLLVGTISPSWFSFCLSVLVIDGF